MKHKLESRLLGEIFSRKREKELVFIFLAIFYVMLHMPKKIELNQFIKYKKSKK